MKGEVRIQGFRVGAGGDQWVQESSVFLFGERKFFYNKKSLPKCIPCCIKIKQNPYMLKHPRIPPLIST